MMCIQLTQVCQHKRGTMILQKGEKSIKSNRWNKETKVNLQEATMNTNRNETMELGKILLGKH